MCVYIYIHTLLYVTHIHTCIHTCIQQIKWDHLDYVGLVQKVIAGDSDVGFVGSDLLQALADQKKVCMYLCVCMYVCWE
jgi:hypothetical protein